MSLLPVVVTIFEKGSRLYIEFKLNEGAITPEKATEGSAGWDLYAWEVKEGPRHSLYMYDTGVSVAIPWGHVGLLFPRSSISKTDFHLRNCVGVIDSDYRGTIKMCFQVSPKDKSPYLQTYVHRERIGQLVVVPAPTIEMVEVDDLPSTTRGAGGFGSTGKRKVKSPYDVNFIGGCK